MEDHSMWDDEYIKDQALNDLINAAETISKVCESCAHCEDCHYSDDLIRCKIRKLDLERMPELWNIPKSL